MSEAGDETTIEPNTKRLARYLFRMIDKRDWGYWDRRDGRPKYARRQSLNRALIQANQDGRDRIYYTSRRNSGFCLAMIDVDQHDGQTDGLDLVLYLVRAHFPGAYWEPSRRGFHVYVPFRCKTIRRTKMNSLLAWLCTSLRIIAASQGYKSTIDVTGGFSQPETIDQATGELVDYRHGTLAAVPRPADQAALNRLIDAPTHLVGSIFTIGQEAQVYAEVQGEDHRPKEGLIGDYSSRGKLETLEYQCGFRSMHQVAQALCQFNGQAPDGPTLLAAYCERFQKVDDQHERRDRAERIARFYQLRHNPVMLAGFRANRPRLLALIAECVTDWTLPPAIARKIRKLCADDLAVVLFSAEMVSFTKCENAALQFGMPRARLVGLFAALADRGDIARPRTEGKELRAILDVLSRASLIDCLDKHYQFNGGNGIGQKWTIGQAHPRYMEFLRETADWPLRLVGTAAGEPVHMLAAA